MEEMKIVRPLPTCLDWANSIASMFLFSSLYGLLFGSLMAGALFTALILFHEAGHWLYFRKIGMNPEPPVFIPFVGALIRITKKLTPDEEVKGSLAGPLLGGVGVLLLLGFCLLTGSVQYYELIKIGIFINLLNLIPLSPLDGGRVALNISKKYFWIGVLSMLLVVLKMHWFLLAFILVILLQNSRVRPLWKGIARASMLLTGGFLVCSLLNWYHLITLPLVTVIGGFCGRIIARSVQEDKQYSEEDPEAIKADKIRWSLYYLGTALFLGMLYFITTHLKPLLSVGGV